MLPKPARKLQKLNLFFKEKQISTIIKKIIQDLTMKVQLKLCLY